ISDSRNETLEIKRLEDLRRRVALSSASLPSICFFTFLNSHNRYAPTPPSPSPRLTPPHPASSVDLLPASLYYSSLICAVAVLRSINCVDITRDASVVAGGYADSSIKVWDLHKDHQRIFGTYNEEAPSSRKRSTDYVQLLGHSGTVYAS